MDRVMSEPNLSNEEIADKTRKSLLWFTIVPFTMQVLRFGISILLARILSPSDFGLIGIISVLLYYCDSFSDFGFSKAIVQKKSIIQEHYSIFFTFNIVVSMCFFVAAQGFSGSIASFFETQDIGEALQVFSFLFLITAVSAGPLVKLKRELNFKAIAIIQAIRMSITMTLSLILALKGFAFWSIIYAMLFSHVIELLLLLYTTRQFPRISLEFGYLKELLHFGLWDFIGAQCRLVSENIDKIIIGKILGTTSLGYYDKAYGISRMPNDQISVRLSLISFSSFSRVQDDEELLEKI